MDKLERWNNETWELANLFAVKYFGPEATCYWIADEIGGVFVINDYFFNLRDIVDFIKYGYSKKKMFEYYDYAMEQTDKKGLLLNIKNYKKLK